MSHNLVFFFLSFIIGSPVPNTLQSLPLFLHIFSTIYRYSFLSIGSGILSTQRSTLTNE